MQFGKALNRILQHVFDANPRYGPVYMSKIDIADGFYRIGIHPEDAIKLAVLFPTRPGDVPLIGIPLTLPMGWVESPPAFCTATETTADLTNAILRQGSLRPHPHRLDDLAETPPAPAPTADARRPTHSTPSPVPIERNNHPRLQKPIAYTDVYVDDFLLLSQGNKRRRKHVKQALLHSLDRVFRPLDAADNSALIKKLKKGDATWQTQQTMLGWVINSTRGTIELPPHRVDRLHDLLNSICPTRRLVPTKTWHKLLGELRSMAIAIPGAQGLFSLLQEAFRHEERQHSQRVLATKRVHYHHWPSRILDSRPSPSPTRTSLHPAPRLHTRTRLSRLAPL